MKHHEYAVQICWSKEDEAYLAAPCELAGCVADGQTPEEALANLRVVIEEWIEVAKAENRPIPTPMSAEDFERLTQKHNQQLHKNIQQAVQAAVEDILRQLAAASPPQRGAYSFEHFRLRQAGSELDPAGFTRR